MLRVAHGGQGQALGIRSLVDLGVYYDARSRRSSILRRSRECGVMTGAHPVDLDRHDHHR